MMTCKKTAERKIRKTSSLKILFVGKAELWQDKQLPEHLLIDQKFFKLCVAPTTDFAVKILETEKIDLVVIKVSSEYVDTNNFLLSVSENYPEIDILLIVKGDGRKYLDKIPREAFYQAVDEPPNTKALFSIISNAINKKDDGFAGVLKNIHLENLIQLYCLSAETITINIRHKDDMGTIYLDKGDIVHAETKYKSGEEAFYTIMNWKGGRIETGETAKPDKCTITKNHQFLLLEASRLRDEGNRNDDEVPDASVTASMNDVIVMEEKKLRALIVDDSAFMRKIISNMLTAEGDIEVAGTANNGKEAIQFIDRLNPDFITLDVNMPVMDGATALKHIMIKNPCPVIVMSNLASDDHDTILNFLNLGAVDFLPKPVKNKNILVQQQQILSRARTASKARMINYKRYTALNAPDIQIQKNALDKLYENPLVVFVSGLGGYHEMLYALSNLPEGLDAYFTAFQNLPEEFTDAFTASVKQHARLNFISVGSKRKLEVGSCYISSSESQLISEKNNEDLFIMPDPFAINDPFKVSNIDAFLLSAKDTFKGRVYVVLFSGADSVTDKTLAIIHENNGKIFVQDPSSCMVTGSLEKIVLQGLADIAGSPKKILKEVLSIIS